MTFDFFFEARSIAMSDVPAKRARLQGKSSYPESTFWTFPNNSELNQAPSIPVCFYLDTIQSRVLKDLAPPEAIRKLGCKHPFSKFVRKWPNGKLDDADLARCGVHQEAWNKWVQGRFAVQHCGVSCMFPEKEMMTEASPFFKAKFAMNGNDENQVDIPEGAAIEEANWIFWFVMTGDLSPHDPAACLMLPSSFADVF